jgi:hypothetical protein
MISTQFSAFPKNQFFEASRASDQREGITFSATPKILKIK